VLALARALENGAFAGPLATALGRVWEHTLGRTVVRRLTWPSHVRVVTVGGATLGGSGKTPLAMACAAALATDGTSVALVGHAYRATPRHARVVRGDDPLDEVGDEALLAARALGPAGVRVVVAPERQDAVELASRFAEVIVIDGVVQTAPVRASLSILAVDAAEPWGHAVALPPGGDLRAPVSRLVEACDLVVAVGDAGQAPIPAGTLHAPAEIPGAWVRGELVGWDELAGLRLGLLSALARPDRVVRSLERRGGRVTAVVRAPDHGPFGADSLERASGEAVDLWVATPKCALHLFAARAARSRSAASREVGVLRHACALPVALARSLSVAGRGSLSRTP